MDVDEIQIDVGSSSAAVKSSGGKKDKSSLPWVEKYRPDSLDELIAHEDIIKILNQLIESNRLPHLLFYGPPGTGTCLFSCYRPSLVEPLLTFRVLSLQERPLPLLPVRRKCTVKTTPP